MSTPVSDTLTAELERRLYRPLQSLRFRVRGYLALLGLRWLIVAMILAGVAQMALDLLLRFTVDQRALISGVAALYWLWVAYRGLYVPLSRPLPDRLLAGIVDRAHPELHDRFLTAVEFAGAGGPRPTGTSPELVKAVLADTCRAAEGVSFLGVLNHRRAAWGGVELCGLLVVIALAFQQMPGPMGTWFARNWLFQDVAWPQRTYILPEGFNAEGHRRMARGDPVEITASVQGVVPNTAVLHWWSLSGRAGRETMSVVGDTQLVASVGQLSEDIHFRIVGGDERTGEFVVEAVERPRVMHTLARITPPAYTRLDPVVIEQQTVIELLQGATLELEAQLNKPVKLARFVASDDANVPGELSWTGEAELQPLVRVRWPGPASGQYRFELLDEDDLSNRNAVRYTLKVVPDRPPSVQMQLAGVGESITPQAGLPVELHCEDTYGLGAVRLLVQAGERPERALVPDGFAAGSRKSSSDFILTVGASSVRVGETLRLWAEAEDVDPQGPNVGATPVVTLRVVSRDEFLIEMARRELSLRQEFERLLSGQRRLKDTLERVLSGVADDSVPPTPAARRLAGLARSQATHVSRCREIAEGFDQILREMHTNGVARPADERRITERVVQPLASLTREAIPAAARVLGELRHAVDAELRASGLAAQDDILQQMRDILANMLEWEGYREAVTLLEAVIDAQADLRTGTLEALEWQLEDILGLEEVLEGDDLESPNP